MSSKKTTLLVSAAVLAVASQTEAFVPASSFAVQQQTATTSFSPLFAEETETETEAVFKPADEGEEKTDEIALDKVEMLGRGAAKVRSPLCNMTTRREEKILAAVSSFEVGVGSFLLLSYEKFQAEILSLPSNFSSFLPYLFPVHPYRPSEESAREVLLHQLLPRPLFHWHQRKSSTKDLQPSQRLSSPRCRF